jgi:sugar lactone lactonase YvrE
MGRRYLASGAQTLIQASSSPGTRPTFDSANNLYYCDPVGQVVYKITGAGVATQVTLTSSPLVAAAGFGDIVCDATRGYLYFSSNSDGAVWRVSTAGGTVTQISSGTHSPGSLAIDSSGSVFYNDTAGANAVIYKIATPSGTPSQTSFATLTGQCTGLTIDSSNNLFTKQTTTITRISSAASITTSYRTGLNSTSTTNTCLTLEPISNLFFYIDNSGTQQIFTMAYGANTNATYASPSTNSNGVGVDAYGNLYINDSSAPTLYSVPGLTYPGDVASTSSSLYIATTTNVINSSAQWKDIRTDPTGTPAGSIYPATQTTLSTSMQKWFASTSAIKNGYGSMAANSSNGGLTVPVAGLYQVTLQVYGTTGAATAASGLHVAIYVNGAASGGLDFGLTQLGTASYNWSFTWSGLISLTASQYIAPWAALSTVGTNFTLSNVNNALYNNFSAVLVSA